MIVEFGTFVLVLALALSVLQTGLSAAGRLKRSPVLAGAGEGAALAAECLVTGKELLATPEHALHVLEIITAARESSATGKRIELTSTFKWPVIS